MTSYATAEEYNLESLKEDMKSQGLYGVVRLPKGKLGIQYSNLWYLTTVKTLYISDTCNGSTFV